MIKIRLWGQQHELAEALPAIRAAFNVVYESKLVKDRGRSKLYRLYIEAENKPIEEETEATKKKPAAE